MDKAHEKKYRERLMALAARMDTTVAGLEGEVRTPTGGQASGGLSNAPLHLGDVGSDVISQEIGATLLENETYLRDEVAASLTRLEQGKYGQCENCGKRIPYERLDALPYARYCTPCASKLQSGRAVNLNDGRPAGWLGAQGHETLDPTVLPSTGYVRSQPDDIYAAGTPGGGTPIGGLAGSNSGTGEPDTRELQRAMGSSDYDVDAEEQDEDDGDMPEAFSGPSGGAVGGTPTNKRARGGRNARGGVAPQDDKKE